MKDTRNTGKNPQSLAERVHRMTKELHLRASVNGWRKLLRTQLGSR